MMKKHFFAILALVGMTGLSHGAVIIFSNQNIPIPSTFVGVYVDLETGSNGAVGFAGADINLFFGGEAMSNDADPTVSTPSTQFLRTGSGFQDSARNSALNSAVDAASSFFSSGYGESGGINDHLNTEFTAGTKGYLGFTTIIAGSTTVYGFMEVTLTANGAGIIHGWQYEDTGGAINVVPEPSVGLFSLLSLCILAIRRRR